MTHLGRRNPLTETMFKTILPFIIVLSIASFITPAVAQEHLTGLVRNSKLDKQSAIALKSNAPVRLPFRDDFSIPSVYPRSELWADRFAFINNDYPVDPMTVGVATLDAINDTGAIYDDGGSSAFIADYLTSNAIRLDSLFIGTPRSIKRSDSIYFSFFYQPQGIGNQPNEGDSLVLEFWNSQSSIWEYVWSSDGMSLDTFLQREGVPFKQVIVPIKDSIKYFHPDFRFRFYNFASLSNNSIPSWGGNVDQWHLDYIYLNVNRSLYDTVYNDIGFASSAHSALKDYQSMPWKQYNAAPGSLMTDTFYHKISNIDNITYNTTYNYQVQEETGPSIGTYSGGNINLLPFSQTGYQSYQPHAAPHVNFSFPQLVADTAFIITHVVEMVGSTDDIHTNDTIRFTQRFYNYFAYDDGSAEAGYGLSLTNGRAACQFEVFQPDSLQSVQMFFNRTLNDGNVHFFYLTVWDDNQGHPGNVIYEEQYQLPKFGDKLNEFVTYDLNPAIWVTGKFYIGWRQTTADNLNLGFDLNTNHQTKNFYNTSGIWENSLYEGSLMMRPVLGLVEEAHVGIPEEDEAHLKVFPNPVTDGYLRLDLESTSSIENIIIQIHDAQGRIVMTQGYMGMLDLSHLPNGLYFISATNGRRILAREKFVVAR